MQRLMVSLLIVFGLVLGGFEVASANLISDGGFDNGTILSPYDPGATLNAWIGYGVTIADGGEYGNVAQLDLSNAAIPEDSDPSFGLASLYQTFSVAPGTTALNVSFDYNFDGIDENTTMDDTSVGMLITSGGAEYFWQLTSTGEGFGGWDTFEAIITPNAGFSPINTLQFSLMENFGPDTNTFLQVDNVVVSAVPVPNALLLFGSGLAGLVLFSRKFVR